MTNDQHHNQYGLFCGCLNLSVDKIQLERDIIPVYNQCYVFITEYISFWSLNLCQKINSIAALTKICEYFTTWYANLNNLTFHHIVFVPTVISLVYLFK